MVIPIMLIFKYQSNFVIASSLVTSSDSHGIDIATNMEITTNEVHFKYDMKLVFSSNHNQSVKG